MLIILPSSANTIPPEHNQNKDNNSRQESSPDQEKPLSSGNVSFNAGTAFNADDKSSDADDKKTQQESKGYDTKKNDEKHYEKCDGKHEGKEEGKQDAINPCNSQKANEKEEQEVMLCFTRAVPRFLGRNLSEYGPYDIDDIATLPSEIASILIKKERAEQIKRH